MSKTKTINSDVVLPVTDVIDIPVAAPVVAPVSATLEITKTGKILDSDEGKIVTGYGFNIPAAIAPVTLLKAAIETALGLKTGSLDQVKDCDLNYIG